MQVTPPIGLKCSVLITSFCHASQTLIYYLQSILPSFPQWSWLHSRFGRRLSLRRVAMGPSCHCTSRPIVRYFDYKIKHRYIIYNYFSTFLQWSRLHRWFRCGLCLRRMAVGLKGHSAARPTVRHFDCGHSARTGTRRE